MATNNKKGGPSGVPPAPPPNAGSGSGVPPPPPPPPPPLTLADIADISNIAVKDPRLLGPDPFDTPVVISASFTVTDPEQLKIITKFIKDHQSSLSALGILGIKMGKP